MEFIVRRAIPSDALFLTSISFAAKRYWNYPEEYLEIWKDELTITEEYIKKNIVFVAQKNATIIGYCAISHKKEECLMGQVLVKAGHWLDHIFVRPAYIKKGIGTILIERAVEYCKENQFEVLNIISDPNTNGFYSKVGAEYICDIPSCIEGRSVALFRLPILVASTGDVLDRGLQEKRIHLEQGTLEQKLHELDKDAEEDELYGLYAEQEKEIEVEYKGAVSIEDFVFTAPIGYKFQCEEEIKAEEAPVVHKEISYEEVAKEIEDEASVVAEAVQEYKAEESAEEAFYEVSKKEAAEEALIQTVNRKNEEYEKHLSGEAEEASEAKEEIHVKTEKEKMLSGEQYIAWGDEIVEDRRHARRLLKEFNLTDPEDKKQAMTLLKELLGSTGEYVHIEPDFKCNYGYNIHIGDNFYAGYNCVILDNAPVTIGDNCIISPQVGIYTLGYPIHAERRMAGYEYAKPVTIGNNVWIGGGSVINGGVTIGNDVVIAPGSVVVLDIPDHVVVGGNPAKIIKRVED